MNTVNIKEVLAGAVADGRAALSEPEALKLLGSVGITAPVYSFVARGDAVAAETLEAFPGNRVVVKLAGEKMLHRSDVGGVRVVDTTPDAVRETMSRMLGAAEEADGVTLHEYVPHGEGLGGEFLLGLRWTDEFGPVVVLGAGGIYTEHLAENFLAGRELAVASVNVPPRAGMREVLSHAPGVAMATGKLRAQRAAVTIAAIAETVDKLTALSDLMPHLVREVEINPLAVSGNRLLALDALVKLGGGTRPEVPTRPVHKLANLLEPRTVAVMGVSRRMNPGHVILGNLIRDGFARSGIYVIKPDEKEIDGCQCVPDIASLPEPVDLLVLSVDARAAAVALRDAVKHRMAESVVVIPGGFEEKTGNDDVVRDVYATIAAARKTDWGGPVINGGNCLGVVSRPGRCDTMFIPGYKFGKSHQNGADIALISQSGAFAVSKTDKLSHLNKKYSISLGNQMDLTIGDYLNHLKKDPDVTVFAVYAEGFRPLDGERVLRAIDDITSTGRTVVLYRAGRTKAGARASASHTASIAGDYVVTRELAANAGAVVADSIDDFEDLVGLFALLHEKTVGWRLGAISNAGFESVTMADNIGRFQLVDFEPATRESVLESMRGARVSEIVDLNNPLDLTPIMGDAGYEAVARAVVADPNVETAVISCVPLTPALSTLAQSYAHREDAAAEEAVGMRIMRVAQQTRKACVAVVDAGPAYDPMAQHLISGGVPTFRTADRAMRLLNIYCGWRMAHGR